MFIKPSKKWRNPEGNDAIMVPYTYYRLCESYRDTDGKVKQRTVPGLGELLDFPTELGRKELADLLTEMINEGTFRLCDKPELYDEAVVFYGKWLEEKEEAQERADEATRRMHGKYLLQTSLDEKDEENVLEFYNVIRTVEETFKTLKSNLDIRPVSHKTDEVTKAHLNLAVLAYWGGLHYKMPAEAEGCQCPLGGVSEAKLTEIQTALGITALPVCSIKSVWLREQAPEKDLPSKSGG